MARRAQTREIGRIEAFSDAVLAIVLTLLVLELLPEGARSPEQLLDGWPTYLAFLTAFLAIGIVWLNHNEAISRLRRTDPVVLVLNLGLLLGATLVPWPTALVSSALEEGDRADQVAAMVVFAIVTVVISVPWAAMDLYLARHPSLLTAPDDVAWVRRHALTSAGTMLVAAVSVALAFVSPLASLLLYLPVFAVFIVARLLERRADAAPRVPGTQQRPGRISGG
ncbi:TMEM175 family protein [uncultured Amnibacterium sp.]|uniref:TMEM175 family protein n=1 Tax=uncultured Amnibacterium sp. TaxID=1631851 RepID=UPI0035C98E46